MLMTDPTMTHVSMISDELLSRGTLMRLLMACGMGGIIGLEREWRHKASGLRTNMLICMGCALFTVLSEVLAGSGNLDKSRVASNIVQGIGFLGAGLILHTRDRVVGLTSAATVFVVASIGMACGAGLYFVSAIATLMVLLALMMIGMLEWKIGWQRYPLVYEIRGTDTKRMYMATLGVLDPARERLNVMERQTIGDMERITFEIKATRRKHERLLQELRSSHAMDEVVVFRDPEEE